MWWCSPLLHLECRPSFTAYGLIQQQQNTVQLHTCSRQQSHPLTHSLAHPFNLPIPLSAASRTSQSWCLLRLVQRHAKINFSTQASSKHNSKSQHDKLYRILPPNSQRGKQDNLHSTPPPQYRQSESLRSLSRFCHVFILTAKTVHHGEASRLYSILHLQHGSYSHSFHRSIPPLLRL